MTKIITDAQVEVAEGAYMAVEIQPSRTPLDAMRAALEAYERVRDVDRILAGHDRVELAENDARAERGLKNLHRKLQKDYPR